MFQENHTIPPPESFASQANLKTTELAALHAHAAADYEGYWAHLARTRLHWTTPFTQTLDWKPPFARWFADGTLNASQQCLDRHLNTPRRSKTALVWESEQVGTDGITPLLRRVFTYEALHREVARFAAGLTDLGVRKGDRVALYLPLIPEAAIAMLACARLGATHSVVFGGFSAEALRDRIQDAQARFVITANGGFRRGRVLALQEAVNAAVAQCPSVEKIVVVDRLGVTGQGAYALTSSQAEAHSPSPPPSTQSTGTAANISATVPGREFWYHDTLATWEACATPVEAEHPLFILYTSGTTGKPKGVVHSTAGYLLWACQSSEWVFDLKESDVYWCTADVGWVTGHSYVVYGPLACGATTFLYEGAPDFPTYHRFWRSIEREKVSIFYTAPTAIRAFMRQGDAFPQACNLSSLRLLGSVGEPINPEAWMWYHRTIGQGRCPIVDTWWQTETGGIMVSPLPGITNQKPGSATRPLPGLCVDVVDDSGASVPAGNSGKLVITKPWPSQLRTVFGDPERYQKTYWSQLAGPLGPDLNPYYFTGDGAYKDANGDLWITGRIDDVMNVAGHRLGTMEIESALVGHPHVAEAAVVGAPDPIKGTAIFAFVTLRTAFRDSICHKEGLHKLLTELREHVAKDIGPFARPEHIRFTEALPKTRSGKIMRRLLRDIASGSATLGDTTTLEDVSVLAALKDYQEED